MAVEALKGQKTLNELATEYAVHPVQIAQWKKRALDELPQVFEGHASRKQKAEEALLAQLYQEIGQLKVELDWLRKRGALLPSRNGS